jgi:hypothetical protein
VPIADPRLYVRWVDQLAAHYSARDTDLVTAPAALPASAAGDGGNADGFIVVALSARRTAPSPSCSASAEASQLNVHSQVLVPDGGFDDMASSWPMSLTTTMTQGQRGLPLKRRPVRPIRARWPQRAGFGRFSQPQS